MGKYREAVTAIHGMLFGVFFLLAAYALLVELRHEPVKATELF